MSKNMEYLPLKTTLKNYQLTSWQIKVWQEIFLSGLKKSIKSSGFLNKKGEKFQLHLKGDPSSLLLFDGQVLWYQADKKENVVFQSKNHPQIDLLNGFFSSKNFFELFEINQIQKKKKIYIFQIFPKKNIEELKNIFIKIENNYITEIRIIWKNLNSWQKLSFSYPKYKSFSKRFFTFPKSSFQIIKTD